jgi:hypothetical protein
MGLSSLVAEAPVVAPALLVMLRPEKKIKESLSP